MSETMSAYQVEQCLNLSALAIATATCLATASEAEAEKIAFDSGWPTVTGSFRTNADLTDPSKWRAHLTGVFEKAAAVLREGA